MGKETSKAEEVSLDMEKIELSFGGTSALAGVDLEVNNPEVFAIIGPNGAGKTCLLNCINGFYRPQKGTINFNGNDITRYPAHAIAKLGIARTFQNIELYTGLSTVDNLMAARHTFFSYNFVEAAIYFGRTQKQEVKHRAVVERVIDFLEIEEIRDMTVGLLPYGLRKRVELGRALVMEPRVLLLDEPMAGMNVEEKEDMAMFIIDILAQKRIPIIIVEHDMGVVMNIASRVAVFDFGKKIAEGPPQEIIGNEKVIRAYLGKKE